MKLITPIDFVNFSLLSALEDAPIDSRVVEDLEVMSKTDEYAEDKRSAFHPKYE